MPIHRDEIEEDQVSITIDDNDEKLDSGDSNSTVSAVFTENGMIRLPEGNAEHEAVKTSFINGMLNAGGDTNIVAIYKNDVKSDLIRKAKFESFNVFCQAVAQKCGGNPNIRCAWYGGSKEELCEIVRHGFSRCRETPGLDGESYGGVGVHLIPAKYSCDGAMWADVDESGVKHMLLCRVILGKMEMVGGHYNSTQSLPSSNEFDTGVDNPYYPRRYIVWSAFMNSHIFPCFVVSFKAPNLSAIPGFIYSTAIGFQPIAPGVRPIRPGFRRIASSVRPIPPGIRLIAPSVRPIPPGFRPIAPSVRPIAPGFRPIAPSVRPIPPGFRSIAPAFRVKQLIQNALRAAQRSALRPRSQCLSFITLISLLSRFLPYSKMEMLKKVGRDIRANKITSLQAIQRTRKIVGDQLLIAVIKDYKSKNMGIPATKRKP